MKSFAKKLIRTIYVIIIATVLFLIVFYLDKFDIVKLRPITLVEQIPYEEVLFPDCLDYPDKLYGKMRFPREVDYDEFKNALINIVDRRRINKYQPKIPQVLSN